MMFHNKTNFFASNIKSADIIKRFTKSNNVLIEQRFLNICWSPFNSSNMLSRKCPSFGQIYLIGHFQCLMVLRFLVGLRLNEFLDHQPKFSSLFFAKVCSSHIHFHTSDKSMQENQLIKFVLIYRIVFSKTVNIFYFNSFFKIFTILCLFSTFSVSQAIWMGNRRKP